MPGDPGATVVTNSCAFYTLRTRLRVQRAPGIPHALCRAKGSCTTRAHHAARIGSCISPSLDDQDALRVGLFENRIEKRSAARGHPYPILRTTRCSAEPGCRPA